MICCRKPSHYCQNEKGNRPLKHIFNKIEYLSGHQTTITVSAMKYNILVYFGISFKKNTFYEMQNFDQVIGIQENWYKGKYIKKVKNMLTSYQIIT